MIRAIVLNANDNVGTLVDAAKKGDVVSLTGELIKTVTLVEHIEFGHKLAIRDVDDGGQIIKYGKVIGQAVKAIKIGEHVHTHNIEALRARGDKKEPL
jgi:altronate dehydratase small subunit